MAAFAETYGIGVFLLHKVIGFAGDLVPLKMTNFLKGKRNPPVAVRPGSQRFEIELPSYSIALSCFLKKSIASGANCRSLTLAN